MTTTRPVPHPADLSPTTAPPTRRAVVVLRCVIAAVGMMTCAMLPALPYSVPGFTDWLTQLEAAGNITLIVMVQVARYSIAVVAALALLLVIARLEKVRLRDYFGHVGAARAWGSFGATTAGAAVVTTIAVGLVQLVGAGATRGAADVTGLLLALTVIQGLARAFVLQGIHEEWWFRGFAFRGLADRPWFVLGATTLGFTVLHLVSSGGQQSLLERFLYLVLPLGMGLWGGVERWCTGTVWGAVGIHGGVHTGLLVATLLGWGFGPAGWVAVGLLACAVAVVRLLVVRPWTRDA